jgi:hypothetical protein
MDMGIIGRDPVPGERGASCQPAKKPKAAALKGAPLTVCLMQRVIVEKEGGISYDLKHQMESDPSKGDCFQYWSRLDGIVFGTCG